jgi:hypothetical protein
MQLMTVIHKFIINTGDNDSTDGHRGNGSDT